MKISKTTLLILLLLLVASIFLRFYRLDKLFFFNIDEDWFLYIVRKIVIFHKPALIGWEMPGGILTIPVMYYIGAIIMFLSRNNPLGFAVNAALVSSISVVLTFVVGKKIFQNTRLALIAAFIFCFSYLIIIYTRVTLSIYLGPFLSLLTYISLAKIINEKKSQWFYVLVIVFIFATQEGSLLSLIFLSLFMLIKYKNKLSVSKIVIPAVILSLSITPLVIFDLRHDFLAAKRVINFLSFTGKPTQAINIGSPIRSLKLFGNSVARTYFATGQPNLNYQILPCERYLADKEVKTPGFYPYIGFLLVLVFFQLAKAGKLKTIGEELVVTHLLIVVAGLLVYSLLLPSHQYEWFFVVLMPGYAFIGAYLIERLLKTKIKIRILVIVFLALVFLFHNLRYLFTTSTIGYQTKYQVAVYIKEQLKNKTYDLDILGDKCNAYGFRYLLTYLDIEPNISYMDSQYNDWLYPKKEYQEANYKVYIVPLNDLVDQESKEIYEDLTRNAEIRKTIDLVEILIIPNN